MSSGAARQLTRARKWLLAGAGAAAVTLPLAVGLLHMPVSLAQSVAEPSSLHFEVASIKPNHSGRGDFSASHNTGGLIATNASLKNLIKMAYGLKNYQLAGEPGWIDLDRFDVNAKAPAGTPTKEFNPMLANLLAERFKLSFHSESKPVAGYALVVAKSGAKLHASTAETDSMRSDKGILEAKKMSLRRLAESLSHMLNVPVADTTGIQGDFDLKLEWTPDDMQPMKKPLEPGASPAPNGSAGPTIFTAIQEQLGLKLEARKVPVEIMVIDHVERQPIEN